MTLAKLAKKRKEGERRARAREFGIGEKPRIIQIMYILCIHVL